MNAELLLVFALTVFLLSLSPGPAVLLVVSQGTSRSFHGAALSTWGIMTAEAMFFTLSACGLTAVLMASATLFVIIKWLGVAYLLWLGLSMIRLARATHALRSDTFERACTRGSWTRGLLTQLGNPKAVTFFSALLPQFLQSEGSVALQFLTLGAISLAIESTVLLTYGFLAARASGFFRDPRIRALRDRVGGTFLIAAAVGLGCTRA